MSRLRIITQSLMTRLAGFILWRFRPGVIGVTGSVGKTSAKRAIAAVLSAGRTTRWGKGNFNTAIGMLLTLIYDWQERELLVVSREAPPGTSIITKIGFWLKAIGRGIRTACGPKGSYPETLVLEYGIDHPGDMKELLKIVRPWIGVITAIGDIPAHVEFYASPEDVAREKGKLIESLPAAGFAILNADDARVMKLKEKTRAHVMTFGFAEDADVRIAGFEHRKDGMRPIGITFKIEYGGSFVPVRLDGVFGKAHAYAAAAGASAGLIFGMNLVSISEALAHYEPAHGRMELLSGVKENSFVINDAYNAGPLSMRAALATLADLPGKRKIAVLGDMLEIGEFTEEAHQKIGREAAKAVDILVTVGSRSQTIAEAARKAGLPKRSVMSFATVDDAQVPVLELLKAGDLVLVKGSHAIGLEKIVRAITEPAAIV